MIHAPLALPAVAPAPLSLALTFRRVALDDLPRVRGAFAEGYKHAPGVDRMPWRYYKRWVVPDLERVLTWPGADLLGGYDPSGQLCGWIAYSRGRRVDAVHWVSVPYYLPLSHELCIGCSPGERGQQQHAAACPLAPANRTQIRRRGIMTALFDAAQLQERLVYTHRGPAREHGDDRRTMDERLLPWLRSRGHQPAFVKWEEWSK